MDRKVILFGAALIAASALQACGHEGGGRHGFRGGGGGGGFGAQEPSRELQLRRFDANADGRITRDEFDKVIKADFDVADTNHNGVLDPAETRAVNAKLLTDHNTSPIIDWNADGQVTLEEFAAQWRALFERADADRDGIVTADEMARGSGPQGGPRGGPPGEGGSRGGRHGGDRRGTPPPQ